MGIISYAQNFEDVILWRALGHVEKGNYIDIGAQDPIVDSVSKAFYEQGWRGIHVEPTAEFANRLRADRSDEIVVQALVAERPGVLQFYEIPGGGLSTACKDIAEEHLHSLGCKVVETLVTSVTLDDLLALAPGEDIHWLKIDVEGFEREVLAGWELSPRHPWVVVVEATYPNSPIETFEKWEYLLLKRAYRLVYRDGLNRYYLSEKHLDLLPHFDRPPNVFDGFQLSGSATSHTSRIVMANNRELAELNHQKLAVECQLENTRVRASAQQTESSKRERALLVLATRTLERARSESQSQWMELIDRERAFAKDLATVRNEAHLAMEAQSRQQADQERQLQAELAAIRKAKELVEADLLDRERAFAKDLATARNEAHLAMEAQSRQQADQERQLQAELAAARKAKELVEADLLDRERAFAKDLATARNEAHLAMEAQSRQQADQERQLQAELAAVRKAKELVDADLLHRERTLTKQLCNAQIDLNLKSIQLSRLRLKLMFARSAITNMRRSRWWRLTHIFGDKEPFCNQCSAEKLVLPTGGGGRFDMSRESQSNIKTDLKTGEVRAVEWHKKKYGNSIFQNTKSEITMDGGKVMQRIYHINGLALLDGEEFVTALYQLLLKRDPDNTGMQYYLGRLSNGCRKSQLIWQLSKSNEFTSDIEDIPGLKLIIQHEKRRAYWIFGIYYSIADFFAASRRLEYQLVRLASLNTGLQTRVPIGFVDSVSRRNLSEDNDVYKDNRIQSLFSSFDQISMQVDEIYLSSKMRAPWSIESIMKLEGEEFVKASYIAILAREADQHGLEYFYNNIKRGDSKVSVLKHLVNTDEAKKLPNRQRVLEERLDLVIAALDGVQASIVATHGK
ncbi:FkbM family methyltransferase [Ferribacterium limneticum]|uniref:FkbM family methyltransferase n=1 Tax=Ferribacterium limneticum TaxID=76259 RepID=UPI001CFB6815|nr:FkbM family methyltransferase [Ferribacterium limneticum]UCV20753.1 FkbM family methyltransferase [Ferribacterium limneticum]